MSVHIVYRLPQMCQLLFLVKTEEMPFFCDILRSWARRATILSSGFTEVSNTPIRLSKRLICSGRCIPAEVLAGARTAVAVIVVYLLQQSS